MPKSHFARPNAAPVFPHRWIAVAAGIVCLQASLPVIAQTATLPTVTVEGEAEDGRGPVNGYTAKRGSTATKTDTPIAETPQSISVISREQMDARNVQRVTEAVGYTAGVVIDPYGNDTRYDWTLLRGFSAVSDMYYNGLALQGGNFAVQKSEAYGLERVEVLRGPSSVMYGQVGPGGLINQMSKKPTDAPLREMGFALGSFNKRQLFGDFSDKLNEDGSVRYRLTGLVQDASTQVDFTRNDRFFLAPSLAIKVNRDTDLTLLANFQRDRTAANANGTYSPNLKAIVGLLTGGFLTQLNDIPRNLNIGSPGFDGFDRDYASVGYQLEHRANSGLTLRQNVRYEDLDLDYRRTQLANLSITNPFTPPVYPVLQSNLIGVREHVRALMADQHAEFRFGGNGIEHRVLAGLDVAIKRYSEATATGATLINFLPDFPAYSPVAYPAQTQAADYSQRQIGLYVQDQIKIQDRFILSGALRHDWARSQTDGIQTTVSSRQSDSATTGHVGAMYLAGGGVAPYISYSTSFNPLLGTDANTGLAYKPETARQAELGVKYQPPGTKTLITAAVFDLTQKNTLTRNTLIIGDPPTQSGEVKTQGLELEFSATPFRGFDINGSYTYMDGEVVRHRTAAMVGALPDMVPRSTAALFAQYTVQSGAAQRLTIGAGVRYIGEMNIRDQQSPLGGPYLDFKTPGYTVADFALRYPVGNWTLAFNINNVFDKQSQRYCGNQSCIYNTAREVVASARYRW